MICGSARGILLVGVDTLRENGVDIVNSMKFVGISDVEVPFDE